jgi:hypothetical protein
MQASQRYMELTHFVGRALQSDDNRFALLVEIITSGWLRTSPKDINKEGPHGIMINPDAKISSNEMYVPMAVCFCDIPVGDFGIHMSKYSRFGISFLKSFLHAKAENSVRVNPAFYITRKAAEEFDKISQRYFDFFFFERFTTLEQMGAISKEENQMLALLKVFLEFTVFSHFKCFEFDYPDGHPENYYMEREWRVLGNLNFKMNDVYRVILPQEYAARFREQVPGYSGQITFAD